MLDRKKTEQVINPIVQPKVHKYRYEAAFGVKWWVDNFQELFSMKNICQRYKQLRNTLQIDCASYNERMVRSWFCYWFVVRCLFLCNYINGKIPSLVLIQIEVNSDVAGIISYWFNSYRYYPVSFASPSEDWQLLIDIFFFIRTGKRVSIPRKSGKPRWWISTRQNPWYISFKEHDSWQSNFKCNNHRQNRWQFNKLTRMLCIMWGFRCMTCQW